MRMLLTIVNDWQYGPEEEREKGANPLDSYESLGKIVNLPFVPPKGMRFMLGYFHPPGEADGQIIATVEESTWHLEGDHPEDKMQGEHLKVELAVSYDDYLRLCNMPSWERGY